MKNTTDVLRLQEVVTNLTIPFRHLSNDTVFIASIEALSATGENQARMMFWNDIALVSIIVPSDNDEQFVKAICLEDLNNAHNKPVRISYTAQSNVITISGTEFSIYESKKSTRLGGVLLYMLKNDECRDVAMEQSVGALRKVITKYVHTGCIYRVKSNTVLEFLETKNVTDTVSITMDNCYVHFQVGNVKTTLNISDKGNPSYN